MAEKAKIGIEVDLETGKLTRKLNKLQEHAKKSGRKVGKNLKDGAKSGSTGIFGNITKQLVGLQLVNKAFSVLKNTIRDGVNDARNFTRSIAEINTILPNNARLTEGITESLKGLSVQYGTSSTQQAKSFYQVVSAGITDTVKASEALTAANELALGGLGDVTSAVDILTDILNTFGKEGLTAKDAIDSLFQTVKLGKTTIPELSDNLGLVLKTAQSSGVSFDQLNAALATLTVQGTKTVRGTVQLNAFFSALTVNAKKLGKELDFEALKRKGLPQFLTDLTERTGGSVDALKNLLGNQRAVRAAVQLTGVGVDIFNDKLDGYKDKANAASKAAQTLKETADFKLTQADKAFDQLGQNIAEIFLPILGRAAKMITNTLQDTGVISRDTKRQVEELKIKIKEMQAVANQPATGFMSSLQISDALNTLPFLRSEIDRLMAPTQRDFTLDLISKQESQELTDLRDKLRDVKNDIDLLNDPTKIRKTAIPVPLLGVEEGAIQDRIKFLEDAEKKATQLLVTEAKKRAKELTEEQKKLLLQTQLIGFTQLEQITIQEQNKLALIQRLREEKLGNEAQWQARETEIARQANEQRQIIRDNATLKAEVSFKNLGKAWDVTVKRMSGTAGELAGIFKGALVNGIGRSFQAVGAAMANGTNMFQAFGDAAKAVFADLASALGDFYIKAGIAELAASSGAKGADTVAAGAGLKVLSGFLGASGAGGSGASASSGGGGATDFAPDAGFETGALDQQETITAEDQTQVFVKIDQVLDGDESGTRIVDIINENFQKTGSVLTDVRTA